MRRTAALIIGGGPAGSAAAITLARGGLVPELIERSAGPRDVVCGGFLGWDALAALRRLGIDAAALGARPIGRLRLVSGRRIVEADLPHPAAGLSRRRLDEVLLGAAEAAGARLMRGHPVREVDAVGRVARLDDGTTVAADALFLATGKHELRGAARQTSGRGASVGLRTALPAGTSLLSSLDGYIELHLFEGGYAGLLLQEDGTANLCLSVAQRRLTGAGGVQRLIEAIFDEAPLLRSRIAAPPARWDAIAGVPYGWREGRTAGGLFRVGDQAAVIASLAGDGIAIALESGIAAAEAMLANGAGGAPAFQQRFARRARRPLAIAELLRFAAERPYVRPILTALAGVPRLPAIAARLTRIA